ncbi:MAG: 2-dehydropantoate 2-reductase [Lachnospiraceae bacterium]|nr:2-dehydropantoate 2-reductase [Lachnospiraceae bacterium]
MKYLIIGTGGTGGPVGAFLARAGKDVTFIARGEHLKAMKEHGLKILHPDGAFTIDPVKTCTMEEYDGRPDVVIVCVKGYSMNDVMPFLQRITKDCTPVIIPILNIYGTGGMMQAKLPGVPVTDGCIYVAAQIDSPGVIKMNGKILRVVFGPRSREEYLPVFKEIEEELIESGITGILSDNIQRDALVKFSYVSPQGACGTYYGVPAGPIQQEGEYQDCFVKLVKEVEAIGHAMGITFKEDLAERNLKILKGLVPTATTSMQRDIMAGRPSEVDGLVFEVVRLGEKLGIPVPEYTKIAEKLKGTK